MKKLLACASALIVLSACADTSEEATEEAVEEVAEAGPVMEDYLGSWDVVYPDGATGVTTNNADGTFERVAADGTVDTGTWTFGSEESCWTAVGEEPGCYVVSGPGEGGMRTLTMADGNVLEVTPIAEVEAETEAAAE